MQLLKMQQYISEVHVHRQAYWKRTDLSVAILPYRYDQQATGQLYNS